MTAKGLGIFGGLAFEEGGSHVIQEDVKFDAEEVSESFLEVFLQLLFMRQELVQGPVQTVGIDLGRGDADQILHGALGIPNLLDGPFAAWGAEPSEGENLGHNSPGYFLPSGLQHRITERFQAQEMPEVDSKPGPAEFPDPPHLEAPHVHGQV
jgi:hypothetical protein